MFDQPMKHVHVRLDERTIELARAIGDGNLSLGLRIAIKIAEREYTEAREEWERKNETNKAKAQS